jgi:hypothetical protein
MTDARSDAERCTCADPIVVVKAVRKGAASSTCARCGRPIRLTFA